MLTNCSHVNGNEVNKGPFVLSYLRRVSEKTFTNCCFRGESTNSLPAVSHSYVTNAKKGWIFKLIHLIRFIHRQHTLLPHILGGMPSLKCSTLTNNWLAQGQAVSERGLSHSTADGSTHRLDIAAVEPGNGHVIQSSQMLRNAPMAHTDKSSA
jgi:hypothetical protein